MAEYHKPPQSRDELYGFDIGRFRSILGEADILKPTKWMFSTTVPQGLVNRGAFPTNAARNLQFWASAAAVPGAILVTHDTMRYGYGVAVKRPYSPAFTPLQITFTADGLGASRTFFNQWINLIIPFNLKDGIDSPGNQISGISGGGGYQQAYEVAYPDDYTVDTATVSAFVDTGEEILRIIMRQAFPVAVSDQRHDWADVGGPARFNVIMQFTDWYQFNLPMQASLGARQDIGD